MKPSDNPLSETTPHTRVDKWLWVVRVYKTRSQATEACRAGHVKIGGEAVKPARQPHPGEIITARAHDILRTVKVLGLLEHRVSAKVASQYMEDLTPPEEYAKARAPQQPANFFRPKGAGRPTKRERRTLESFREEQF
ncbi:MAG: RNA-binding S4 domain-containing protein [Verrucomicrobiota bacterium]